MVWLLIWLLGGSSALSLRLLVVLGVEDVFLVWRREVVESWKASTVKYLLSSILERLQLESAL